MTFRYNTAVFILALFLVSCLPAELMALDVDADLAADATWGAADSPVVINKADFTVPEGVTLTIEPGVSVEVKSFIYVYGVLSAVGTSGNRITFDKHAGETSWAGIHFEYTASGVNDNQIKYADFSNTGDSNGSVNTDRQSLALDNCTITVTGDHDRCVYGWGGIVKPTRLYVTITNNTITLDSSYEGGWSGEVKGIYLDGVDAEVSGNTIDVTSGAENGEVAGIWLTVTNTESSTVNVDNNIIDVTGTHDSIDNLYGIYYEEHEVSGAVTDNTVTLWGPRSLIGLRTYGKEQISGNDITGVITTSYVAAKGYGIYSLAPGAGSDDYIYNNKILLSTNKDAIYLYGIFAQCGMIRNNAITLSHSADSGRAYGLYTDYYAIYIKNNSFLISSGSGVAEYCLYFGTHYVESNTSYAKNNILEGSKADVSRGIYKSNSYAASVDASWNCVYNFTDSYEGLGEGTGDTSSDPDFADGDLHLNAGSPAIDAGDWSSDHSNEPVPNGGRVNMGAYGNTASAATSATAVAAPVITTNDGEDFDTSESSLTLQGRTVSVTQSITVNSTTQGVSYTAGETYWSYTTDLESGSHVFSVKAVDGSSNESAADTITVTCADTTAPRVNSTSPSDGSSGTGLGSSVSAEFSEVIDQATLTTATFKLASEEESISGSVSYSGTTATFAPLSSLSASTLYTATITVGVKDPSGNALASDYSWSFTTGSAPDTTPPVISSVSPADGATGVAINTSVSAVFSESVDPLTLDTASFYLAAGGSNVPSAVSYSSGTAALVPSSSLDYNTTYSATILSAVKDTSGNAMAADHTWSFTTGGQSDTTAPSVSSLTPTDGASGVSTGTAVTAVFSEDIKSSTVTTVTFAVTDGTDAVQGSVSVSGDTAVFTPLSSLSAGTQYTVVISSSITDAAGNAMAADYTCTFTTASAASPSSGGGGGGGGCFLNSVRRLAPGSCVFLP